MRTFLSTLCLVFALAAFGITPAIATCEAHKSKATDFETPPPAPAPAVQNET